jgi:hypothetical protein
MPSKLAGHLRHNAIAYLALFVALSGTATAATIALKANSVGTTQIKNGAVTSSKLGNGAVTTQKLSKTIQTALGKPTSETLMMGGSNTTTNGLEFLAPDGLSAPAPSAIGQEESVAVASKATQLNVQMEVGPPVNYKFTLLVNNVQTDLSCTILVEATSCSDATHSVSIPAGATLALGVDSTSSNNTGELTFGWIDTTG